MNRKEKREIGVGFASAVFVILLAVMMGCCQDANAQGVVVPDGGFANTQVSATGQGSQIYNSLAGVPESDSHKWNITLFVDRGQTASRRVEQLFNTDPHLQQLRQWGNYQPLDSNHESQRRRFQAFQVTEGRTPTLVVYPPKNSSVYEYRYVGRLSGDSLASKSGVEIAQYIATKVRDEVQRVTGSPCPGPEPCPTPWRPLRPNPRPNPSPYPSPNPGPNPPPLPDIPDVSPEPRPDEPYPDDDGGPQYGPYPDHVEVVLITDPRGLFEKAKERALIALFERARSRSTQLSSISFKHYRIGVDCNTPSSLTPSYPVTSSQTPSVIITEAGDLRDKMTAPTVEAISGLIKSVLPGFGEEPDRPEPQVHVPPPDLSGIEQTLAQQQEEQSKLAAAREKAAAARQAGLVKSMANTVGLAVGGPLGILALLAIGYGIWFWRKGGVSAYRDRREDRWDWVEDHVPGVGGVVERTRDRFDWDDEEEPEPPKPAKKRPSRSKAKKS